MGSFAAAVVAGCIRVEDALALVVRQADDFTGRCSQGGTIAVLAGDHLHRQESLRRHSVIASYNFDSHFVLPARTQHLTGIVDFLRASGATFQSLPVAFAYHSPWIEEARSSLENAAQQVAVQPANIPLVCCAKSDVITDLPSAFFWDAVRQPIRFRDTVSYLEAKGPHCYLDLGAAGTLVTFLKYLLPANTRSTFNSILTPCGRDLDSLHSAVRALIGRPE
jgi:acyl transferase domain-containing protein